MKKYQSLITGSLAYDVVLKTDSDFSVGLSHMTACIAPTLNRHIGGCAGNIAYALKLLGEEPLILGVAGKDFSPYRSYLQSLNIETKYILECENFFTAQAYIVNDIQDNQLIIFHPGATNEAHHQPINFKISVPMAIVSPNGKQAMVEHCQNLSQQHIPFIFDPGQAINLFSDHELKQCVSTATITIVNHAEKEILQKKTNLNQSELIALAQTLISTHSEKGSEVWSSKNHIETKAVLIGKTQDPTGCGDAYRAGLIFCLCRHLDWKTSIQFSSIIAGIKATHYGGQGYQLSLDQVVTLYQEHFNDTFPI